MYNTEDSILLFFIYLLFSLTRTLLLHKRNTLLGVISARHIRIHLFVLYSVTSIDSWMNIFSQSRPLAMSVGWGQKVKEHVWTWGVNVFQSSRSRCEWHKVEESSCSSSKQNIFVEYQLDPSIITGNTRCLVHSKKKQNCSLPTI